jgi:hypothetical protein
MEKITGELAALATGVQRAQGQAGAAEHQAQDVPRRATAAGFAAVAAGMTRVQGAIAQIRGGLSTLAGVIEQAIRATTGVAQQPSLQETIAAMASVRTGVDGIRETAGAVIAQIGQAQQLVTAALQGGQPGPLLQALDGIRQVVAQMAQQAGTVLQTVDAVVAQAAQLGTLGN